MLLTLLTLVSMATSVLGQIQMPPPVSVYTSATRSRGFFFRPPVDIWFIGARMEDEFEGRQLLDVVLINGPPATYPAETAATSLFHYNRTDLDTAFPNYICIQPTLFLSAGGYYGIIAGRVQDEQARNVSYSYSSFNNYDSEVNGQFMLLKRLMNQRSIFDQETETVSTDDTGYMALVKVVVSYQEPTNLPSWCVDVPPNPDNPPVTTTSSSSSGSGYGNSTGNSTTFGTTTTTLGGDNSGGGGGRQVSAAPYFQMLF